MSVTSRAGRTRRGLLALAAGLGLALTGAIAHGSPAATTPAASHAEAARTADVEPAAVRRAVFVGNNWDGTADVLDPTTMERLGRINVIPDKKQRMREIMLDPYRFGFFLGIRTLIGEGNDQYVDDMYSSPDGRLLIVSRPSFADVVAISLETGKVEWRFPVEGVRADHMALSPDGTQVAVSASTGNVVHVLRVADGTEVGRIPSGDSPHENIYIDGGERILHASIGTVYSPFDRPGVPDPTEGERVLQIANAETFEVERRYDVRAALDEAGLEDVSEAVRPMTLSPDEQTFYMQLSHFHGFVEMDRASGDITRVKHLPNLIPDTPPEMYLLDSAHHGIAANPDGSKVCVAGTMSDYATLVDLGTWQHGELLMGGKKPYWVTPSWNGRHCLISWSGSDTVSKISYRTEQIEKTVPVGDHPQRVRNGFVARDLVAGLPDPG